MSSLDGEIRDGQHEMSVRVYYEDTDFSGLVYHASYLRFMERGRTNYLRLLGADQRALFEETEKEAPGFAFVVRSMQIEFRKAARMDDVLEVTTTPMRCAAPRSRSISASCARAGGVRVRRARAAHSRGVAHRDAGGSEAGVMRRSVLSTTRPAQCKHSSHELVEARRRARGLAWLPPRQSQGGADARRT